MEKTRVLSGAALVAKGITKIEASLPEIGLKDVAPNGSWLEQKQIQAALEARKYLIEVERIEKCGVLSHAIWRDDLKLAEVTQKSGGHWQYLGHNVGKTLFLNPEETLFLMETNCLQLKHNEVTVSLQKAYSLLLDSSNRIQYQVYASLSRVGYKVFRHVGPKWNDEIKSSFQQIQNVRDHGNVTATSQLEDSQSTNDSASEDTSHSENKEIKTADDGTKKVDPLITNREIEPGNVENLECDAKSSTVVTENESLSPKDTCVEETETKLIEEVKGGEVTDKVVEISINVVSEEITEKCEAISETLVENDSSNKMDVEDKDIKTANVRNEHIEEVSSSSDKKADRMDVSTENVTAADPGVIVMEVSDEKIEISDDNIDDTSAVEETKSAGTSNVLVDLETSKNKNDVKENLSMNTDLKDIIHLQQNHSMYSYVSKIEKMSNRQMKPSNSENIQTYFENIPDLSKQRVFAINVPDQKFIPKNVFVNKQNYVLDMQNIKARSRRSASSDASYSSSDEVNGRNIRRIRSASGTELSQNQPFFPNIRLPRYQFRPYGFWRPQNNINFYQLMFFQARFQYNQRPPPFVRSPLEFIPNVSNARKRVRLANMAHFQAIRNAAVRLKQSLISGITDMRKLEELHNILHSYNMRYKARLRLSENFDVINDEKIVETIELDDDEESKSKKPRLDDGDDKFNENLYRLKQLALRLRELEAKNKATASHRRAFSKAIKTFNQSYKADIYLDSNNYEIIDRKCITLDSSSESDCVVKEAPAPKKRKKLRNPFNILKRRSEKLLALNGPSTSQTEHMFEISLPDKSAPVNEREENKKYSEHILKIFNAKWLPGEDDFGRAEIVSKFDMNTRLLVNSKEQYLHDFMKEQFDQYPNWLEAKISFFKYLEDTNIAINNERERLLADAEVNTGLKPLIDFEDISDMSKALEKLRIIGNNQDTDSETSLEVDFDVYNRDVQNYRKRKPPKPHFRIVCLDESVGVPPAPHVMALHSKYKDEVPIVFAVVGLGSVSYVQLNPIDLPIYVPNNDLV
ncbi:unnamed protein product [Spodoptera littoralis]|uniref:tRNA-splicing endonuclease subunit Sen54 N-terminal domain-containing protein n=1 Tax=Spodoptera littoralis TaxID=7109 RepID=A0A9P0NA48_SPOLI|nr:unnamed protein product [Spodoptera littoralis]CAH1645367.1 unnamed protein product [Spodoptera littoralis]